MRLGQQSRDRALSRQNRQDRLLSRAVLILAAKKAKWKYDVDNKAAPPQNHILANRPEWR